MRAWGYLPQYEDEAQEAAAAAGERVSHYPPVGARTCAPRRHPHPPLAHGVETRWSRPECQKQIVLDKDDDP